MLVLTKTKCHWIVTGDGGTFIAICPSEIRARAFIRKICGCRHLEKGFNTEQGYTVKCGKRHFSLIQVPFHK